MFANVPCITLVASINNLKFKKMDRQKLRKKISKNLVSYELPHMTKTFDEIMTYIDDYVNEQLALCNVSNSCGVGDISILIKGLKDISNWDEEQEEWYDDPGHCANMTLIKYYNSKK